MKEKYLEENIVVMKDSDDVDPSLRPTRQNIVRSHRRVSFSLAKVLITGPAAQDRSPREGRGARRSSCLFLLVAPLLLA